MPDIHVPHLGDEEEAAPGSSPRRATHRWKSALKIGLEVLLISSGVFLGLMGEQWREHVQHREIAEASLRRFRTEILTNRTAMTREMAYHVTTRKALQAFFAQEGPKTSKTFDVPMRGLGPVFFERTAWDLALANGSLAYIDQQLAFALSRAYTAQQGIADLTHTIVQSTIYGRSSTQDFEGYWRSVMYYFSDIVVMEPALLARYDEVLPQIAAALGESPATTASSGR